ncbi:hemagglutinin repeat-containing protein [Rahnella bonaserana]|uniref:Hemagglutinin repeat-containing protein n=1 Tax=Rahnella bonaserana TaxID=2816248 RepID=A0ABS6LS29_9GAMM|nr:hemagglutinin repeat-containing protein [Rahnella bonaserana]MBU9854781.1 hemagglutinin repeat-containing protein [Rahnella bonaserana]
MDNHQQPTCFAQSLLSYLICGLLAGQPVFPAFAAPTPANSATGIDKAGNGVPVVNIATPNGAGISHNQFQNYNVGKEGLILNNATGQLNQTQLGGLIQNNPNLKAGQEARGIINEVTGANRSQLNGYTEVAGKAANVMVANPYGITCNGCGFINTPNATLTTGKPVFDASGNLQSLDVNKGSITVEGQGLNASESDALSIISRATEVNAQIHANAMNVITGANRVDKNGRITAIAGEGAAPVVAVDTGALGGMYASRIRLISSDKGVGVNLGNLNARQGDITLNASGKLTVQNSLASGSLNAKGESVTLSGEHKASGSMNVSGQDIALSNGTFASDNNIALNSEGKLTLSNTRLTAGKNLSLNAQDLTQDGSSSVNTARDISAQVAGTITNQGQLIAGNNAAISSGSLSNSGKIAAKGTTSISAVKALSNAAGGDILSDEALIVSAENIRQNGTLSGKKSLAINGQSLTAAKGSLSTSLGNVSLKTREANLDGDVIAHGDLSVQANKLTSQRDAQLQSDGSLTLTATDATLYGTQVAQGALTLTAQNLIHGGVTTAADLTVSSGQFNNLSEGLFLSQGYLDISGDTVLNAGQVMANDLSLKTQTFSNEGLWQGTSALHMTADELSTGSTSRTLTAGSLTLDTGLLNTAGTLQGQNVVITARDWTNTGSLLGTDKLDVSLAGTLSNDGDILSQGNANLAAQNIANQGSLLSAANLTLTGESLDNRGALQGNNLVINGGSLNNNGDIIGVNGLVVALTGAFTQHQNKTLLTDGTLGLSAATVNNAGQIQGTDIALISDSVDNSGRIQANNDLAFTGDLTNHAAGIVLSQNTLNLTTPNLVNYGLIQGGGTTRIDASASARNDGKILSGGELTFNTASLTNNNWLQATSLLLNATAIDNSGTVFSTSNLAIHADRIEHRATGKLYSGGNLLLTSNVFEQLGQVVALGNLTLKLTSVFTGKNVLAAGNVLDITSNGAINNQSIMQGQAVNLTAGTALTNNGQITTGSGASALSAESIAMNATGTLQAGGDVALNSRGNITVDGFIGTTGSLTLNAAGNILNTALLYAGNNMYLLANAIHNNHGDILAGNSLWMQRDMAGNANAEVVNTSGNIETVNGDITVKTGHLLNERDGLEITSTYNEFAPDNQPYMDVYLSDIDADKLGIHVYTVCKGGVNTHCTTYDNLMPTFDYDQKRVLIDETAVQATANGGASRISSGRDFYAISDVIDNNSSYLLAAGDMYLTGGTLNNNSVQTGKISTYQTFEYQCQYECGYELKPFPAYEDVKTWVKNHEYNANEYIRYILTATEKVTELQASELYRSVIQAGGNIIANFTQDISNTMTTANAGGTSHTIEAPTLNTLSQPDGVQQQDLTNADSADITSPQWYESLTDAVAHIAGGNSLYPLPSDNNGYFVPSTDANSPYLIITNPKLDRLGQLDQNLFGDLYALMGIQPGTAPRETNSEYTDQNKFLGSAYFLDKLNLHPEYDYRFIGDAAFDTRYVSNFMLNQTGSRYISGLGSDLEQMQYLMDNAAGAQQSLGLAFGVALTATQIAALDSSILWWESASINGQTVMVPKVYLSPKDVTMNNGSVIAGNNVGLSGGNITNSGSTLAANNNLFIGSQNGISNLNASLMQAGGGLQLSALGDINNIGSTISGKTVQLESTGGSINNITQTEQWQAGGTGRRGESVSFSETQSGPMAGIIAQDDMILKAGQDINIAGAHVAAGDNLLMLADGNINVTANQITDSESQSGFRRKDATHSESVTSDGSSITAGGSLGMQAGNDVTIEASQINAGENAVLIAGNDLNLNAAGTRENSRQGKSETHSTDVATTTITSGNDLTLVAGQDINSQAAGIAAEGDVAMQAGRDVNLMAEETTQGDSYKAKKKVEINESVRQDSTEIVSGGNTTIVAGRDVNSEAAQVIASGDIGIGAGRDINLETATESDYHFKEETKTKKGFMKKTTTHTVEEDSATREAGTLLSGDNVALVAGNDLLVKGSAVVGDGNVSLNAGNNIDIVAATNSDSTYRLKEKKKSGMFSGGGIGVTIGTSKSRYEMNDEGTTQSESFSTVGSTGGNVSINAGGQAHIGGADIIAGKDLSIKGDSVLIEPGRDARTHDESFEQKQSGLTIALSGAAGSAVNSAVTTAQSVSDESDDRLAALKIAQGVMSGVSTGQAMELAQATTGDASTAFGISASLGTQSSKSESHSGQNTATGSTLTAGDNLSVTATGGDITAIGSQIKAGLDVALNAADDINLISSQNTQWLEGENSSSGGAIGIGIGMGESGAGINISASGNASRGSESGNGTQHNETTIDAGNRISINSGDDTTIAGAQVSGNSVVADIGGDLTISSLQDSDYYDSSQKSISGGASFSFGTMTGSGGISAANDKMNSDYNSVTEQSGIFAGDGGFDITVGGHTQLDGAVIASTGPADKNRLDTGTLGFSDIGNKAEYSTEHQGAGISTGGTIAENFIGNMANGVLVGAGGEGEASGTTKAAISAGTINIRDTENQQQDVADLSRDVEHANGSISPIFDKEKEQKRLEIAQALGDVGSQAMDIARTAGEIKGLEKAKAAHPELSGKDLLETKEYKDTQKQYGTGSDIQQGISAATMALQGLAGGDMAAALAGGAAPYLAEVVKKATGDNQGANIIAHAVVNAALAAAQGKDAASGAAGAAAGELAGMIALDTYGKPVSELTEQEKQKVLALSTLAAGLAGGLTGDSTADGMTGAIAGNTTVNNNLLGGGTEAGQEAWIRQHGIDMASCESAPGSASCQKAQNERDAVAGAMATAGLIYLPGAMQATGAIGGSANAGIQYLINGEVNPTDVLIATYVGAFTANTGAWGTIGWNAAGGATSNYLKGDDPLTGAGWGAGGAALGYGIGKYVITAPLDKMLNPTWKNYKWVDMGMGISKPLPSSPIPGISGNGGAALSTEIGSQLGPKVIDILEEKLK